MSGRAWFIVSMVGSFPDVWNSKAGSQGGHWASHLCLLSHSFWGKSAANSVKALGQPSGEVSIQGTEPPATG